MNEINFTKTKIMYMCVCVRAHARVCTCMRMVERNQPINVGKLSLINPERFLPKLTIKKCLFFNTFKA